MERTTRGPRFVRWAIMLGIMVVLNLFFVGVRGIVFPQPNYETFCPTPTPASIPAPTSTSASTLAQTQATDCNNAYQAAETTYEQHSFILLVGLGVLSIIIGVLPLGSSIVSSGLSYGGVLSFVIASVQYWNAAGSWIRLLISLIALVALLYIGLKRFKD